MFVFVVSSNCAQVCTCLLFEVQQMRDEDQQYARGGKRNKGGIDCSAALINVAQMAKLTGCVSNMVRRAPRVQIVTVCAPSRRCLCSRVLPTAVQMAALNKTMNAIDIFRSKYVL